jgi:hypothetical protein
MPNLHLLVRNSLHWHGFPVGPTSNMRLRHRETARAGDRLGEAPQSSGTVTTPQTAGSARWTETRK